MLQTPILFIIFNRQNEALKVFEAIRSVKPQKLFVAADGPRYPLKNDYALCEKTRAIVDCVNWPCEIYTFFRATNVGCANHVSGAISWFFSKVEEGIILEDDCLPTLGFFDFCSGMLEKYRYRDQIMMVSGTNYLSGENLFLQGHYFSSFYPIWGWATWRRAWNKFSLNLENWRDVCSETDLRLFFKNSRIAAKWASNFDMVALRKLDSWAIPWAFTCIKNKGLCVAAPQNFVSNIGFFGAHANGVRSPFHEMKTQPFNSLKTLNDLIPDKKAYILDREVYKTIGYLYRDSRWRKIGRIVKKAIGKVIEGIKF